MRKQFISSNRPTATRPEPEWLEIDKLGVVEVTSEDPSHPLESALVKAQPGGWVAAEPGEQIIRIRFDYPQTVMRIFLVFEESEYACTQEFVLRWLPNTGGPYREIVRQQWNFSPPGTIIEREDYQVELPNLTVLELCLIPDKSGGPRRASLALWRVA
jgi:hypothetical protein